MKRASIIFFTPNYSFVALQYIRTLISRSSARSASESPTKDSSVRRFKFFHKSCTCVDREKSSQRMHISSCYCHRVFNHHFFHSSLSINCDYCYRRKKKNPLRTPFPYVVPCWLHHCRHWTLGLSSTLENERWREEKKAEGLARKKSSHVAKTFRALFLSAPESSWALISGDDTSWRQSAVVTGALRSRLSLKYWREFWWLSSSPTPPPILSLTSLLLWHSPLPRCVPPSTNPTTTRTPTKVSTSPFLLLRQLPSTTNGAASAKSNPTHSPWDLIPALFLLLFHSATLSLPFSPSLPLSPSLSLLLLSPFSFFFFHPSFRFWIPRAQPLPFSLISLSLSPSPSPASLDPLFHPPLRFSFSFFFSFVLPPT